MKQYNKTTAAALGGALATVIGALTTATPELIGAIQTLVVSLLVMFVPNK